MANLFHSKSCSSCGCVKALTDFQVRRKSKDGRTASCKSCLSKRDKARDTPERAKKREEYAKGVGKDISTKCKKAWAKRNPEQAKANWSVSNAIRGGKIVKGPCEICGNAIAQAHHDDYNFPLKVRWLCTKHHNEWHKHNEPVRASS